MAHGYSGAVTGEVLAVIKCADWESFGKMMQSMSADSEYQDILSGIVSTGTAELASRSVVVSIDL